MMSTTSLLSDSNNYSREEIREYLATLQSESTLAFIPTLIYMSVSIVVGCVGNCLVIVVYSTKLIRTPLRIFIVSMAIFDLLTNLFVMPAKTHELFNMWDSDMPTLCRLQKYLNSSFVITSGLILVAIATTRYKMVCHPFGKQVTIKQAKIISVILALSAFLISIPYGIIHGTQTKETPNKNINGSYCQVDDSYVKTIWPSLNSGLFILVFLVCSAVIVVFYTCIGRTTWKQQNVFRKEEIRSSGQQTENSTSFTAVCDETHRSSISDKEGPLATSETELVIETIDVKAEKTSASNHEDKVTNTNKVLERGLGLCDTNDRNLESAFSMMPDTQNNKQQNRSKVKSIAFSNDNEQITDMTLHQNEAPYQESLNQDKTSQQKPSTKQRRVFGRTSLMMFIVTLVFVLGFLPFLGLNVFLAISPKKVAALKGASLAFYQLFLSSYLLNSFANPIVYSLLDMRFRKECFKLFKCLGK
ncbi:orexin receptor type 2 [Biomphalaria glabrata]|nr:orexin receptor type 2-like [Biomphalaria glabrata]